MYGQDFFLIALIYLLAAVIAVPLARKLGLGSVLGYLVAGVLIGPFVLGWVGQDTEKVMHFAEFGVVLMLFLIGLEMQPMVLWKMRRTIFGMGGTQMILSVIVIGAIAYLVGYQINQSISIGLIMALSSTAIVLQTLDEKGLLNNSGGRSSFAVLLFQDIAVIPILALLPLMAVLGGNSESAFIAEAHETIFSSYPEIIQILLIVFVGAAVIYFGRIAARHIFRLVAETGMRGVYCLISIVGDRCSLRNVSYWAISSFRHLYRRCGSCR